jgi:hypothetical protein
MEGQGGQGGLVEACLTRESHSFLLVLETSHMFLLFLSFLVDLCYDEPAHDHTHRFHFPIAIMSMYWYSTLFYSPKLQQSKTMELP